MRAARAFVIAIGVCACASGTPQRRNGGDNVSVLVVRTEAMAALDGEQVLAAADDGTRRLLLTAQGAWTFRGSAFERTPGPRAWIRAALIPAADGHGTWGVGLDAGGRLWRIRPGATLEEISDRYGLGHERLRDVAAAGGRLVAFLLDDAVVVADGRRVSRYPAVGARALAAGGRLVALTHAEHIEVLDLGQPPESPPRRRTYAIHATAAAVDARGTLYAATPGALYRAESGTLRLLYRATSRLRWLAAAGARAWFADGEALMALDDGITVAQGAPSPSSQPPPIPTGDGALWLVDSGRPTRLVPTQASTSDERWARLVAPIFARACSECHGPEGKAGVDLSTAPSWLEARDEIRERVLVRRTMPPARRPLSEDDRATVAEWVRGAALATW